MKQSYEARNPGSSDLRPAWSQGENSSLQSIHPVLQRFKRAVWESLMGGPRKPDRIEETQPTSP